MAAVIILLLRNVPRFRLYYDPYLYLPRNDLLHHSVKLNC